MNLGFQVVAVTEAGVPKSQEKIRFGILLKHGDQRLVNVTVGEINITLGTEDSLLWGQFRLGEIYDVHFNRGKQ